MSCELPILWLTLFFDFQLIIVFHLFQHRIGELRLQVSKCKKKMKNAAAEEKALQKFIGDGLIFYNYLLERLDKSEVKYRLMLNLGDLCRYSSENKKAEEFYLKASNLGKFPLPKAHRHWNT